MLEVECVESDLRATGTASGSCLVRRSYFVLRCGQDSSLCSH